jgi:hypothetical protein
MIDIDIKIIEPLLFCLGSIWFIGLFNLDSRNAVSFFPGSLNFSRILETSLFSKKKESQIESDCSKLEQWALRHANKNGISSHWWLESLPCDLQKIFLHCSWDDKIQEMFYQLFSKNNYDIIPIIGMNEMYLTGNNREGNVHSDQVFYMNHIDGPYSFIPFVSVYRCLIALNDNETIVTCFPMISKEVTLKSGDVLSFDFNREIHSIRAKSSYDSEKTPRILLKAHFCVYPKGFHYLGRFIARLNELYNEKFRKLFLHTIQPTNVTEKINSCLVIYGTRFFVSSDMFIGHKNILFVSAIYSLFYTDRINKATVLGVFVLTTVWKKASLLFEDPIDIEFKTTFRDICLYYAVSLSLCIGLV